MNGPLPLVNKMNKTTSKTPENRKITPAPSGLLQRACACGQHTTGGGKCEHCSKGHSSADSLVRNRSESDGSFFQHDFSGVKIQAQAKLRLSQPGDPYELEADRVAEEVVASGPTSTNSITKGLQMLQRQEETLDLEDREVSGEQEAPVMENDEENDIVADETGMPKREAGSSASSTTSVSVPSGGGRLLDHAVRRFMEHRIGHDFSHVRIHTDASASESARQLQAHAYTVGPNIYFNQGKFNPNHREGLFLLAHELTHVVQQTGTPQGNSRIGIQRKRRQRTSRVPSCDGACAKSKSPRHDGCTSGGPAQGSPSITDLTVERAAHQVIATWSNGSTNTWACSPSTRSGRGGKVPTPLGGDLVGIKCDQCHTNHHGDGMGWFTGFSRQGRSIGFHNSQLVGASYESHGCVRVSCAVARTINANSSSGVTTINVVR